jgi:hypothetical protein
LKGGDKILTLNWENAKKMQKVCKSTLFSRYLVGFLSDWAPGRSANRNGERFERSFYGKRRTRQEASPGVPALNLQVSAP